MKSPCFPAVQVRPVTREVHVNGPERHVAPYASVR
jgi:hypothetical protein